jgi:uncharacterized membrane protein
MARLKIKNNQGNTLVIVIIAAIVLLIIGVAGWRVWSQHKNSTTTTTNNSAASNATVDACKKLYNDTDLCKFSGNYNPNASYKATFTTTDKDGKTTTMAIEADSKGNSSTTTSGTGTDSAAFVSLNGDTYIKDPTDNSWIKYPKSPNTPAQTSPTTDLKIDFKDEAAKPQDQQITYKKLGKEACGKDTCLKYQVVDPSQPGTTSYIWIGTKDYQLHQWSFTDKDGSKNVGTFTYASVNIQAPSPVKVSPSATDVPTAQ